MSIFQSSMTFTSIEINKYSVIALLYGLLTFTSMSSLRRNKYGL
jgi:hypothetical protein